MVVDVDVELVASQADVGGAGAFPIGGTDEGDTASAGGPGGAGTGLVGATVFSGARPTGPGPLAAAALPTTPDNPARANRIGIQRLMRRP